MKIGKEWNSETQKWQEVRPTKSNFNYGESETDKSKFRPNVSRLNNIAGASDTTQGIYEFEDGIDNGDRYYALRSMSLDITERQEWVDNVKAKGNEAMAEMKTKLEEKLAEQKAQNEEKIENNTIAKATTSE